MQWFLLLALSYGVKSLLTLTLSYTYSGGIGPNSTPSHYSVQFHVYRLLIAPSIFDNLIIVVPAQVGGVAA